MQRTAKKWLADLRWGSVQDTKELGIVVLCGAALLAMCGCSTVPVELDNFEMPVPLVHYAKFEEPINTVDRKFNSLDEVNKYVNTFPYVRDAADIWQQPQSFYIKGGDCEDFALAKYSLIKANGLGKPRLFMVFDRHKQDIHMLVVVNHRVLDNQNPRIVSVLESTIRYQYLAEVETP